MTSEAPLTLCCTLLLLSLASVAAVAAEPMPPHERLKLESRATAETRPITIYLPPGYDVSDARYDVLYVPDGGEGEDFPHVATTIDELIRAGDIPPMLVVGVENTERRRDMTGPTQVAQDREIAPEVGGSVAFRRFFADELIPVIDSRYRTSGRSAVVGESLAGLFIVETYFLQPDLFDTYIALDPSLWWNNEQWTREAAGHMGKRKLDSRLYLATGGEESNVKEVTRLAQAMCSSPAPGLQWRFEPRPDLDHGNIYRGMERGIYRMLFAQSALLKPDCAALAASLNQED